MQCYGVTVVEGSLVLCWIVEHIVTAQGDPGMSSDRLFRIIWWTAEPNVKDDFFAIADHSSKYQGPNQTIA